VSEIAEQFVALPAEEAQRAGAGGHPCQGVYYSPAHGAAPRIALIATHYNVDFSEHYLADHLARRGFGFLGWNTRFRGNEGYFLLESALDDIALGVRWLREHGAETVVLLGNSGGGSLMAAYQATAQQQDDLQARGDLYISLAAHPGRPQVLTAWMDASAIDERDPTGTDPALDIFDPDNGPPYGPEFIAHYRAAQDARNRRITNWAKAELQRLHEAGFTDRVFTLQRTWADPRMVDPTLDPSDRPTPACYLGDPARANRGVFGIGIMSTLRTWLAMWSLEDSRCGGAEHLAEITLPALVIQATMDVGVFPSDAAAIFGALGSTDKRLEHLPGDHYFREPGGARDAVADLIAGWISERT
jgi:alpha-beta hydrolase superfamily lysophospholipase